MTMERGQSGLRRMGDGDLAQQLVVIQREFTRRHTEIRDIPLEGELPERPTGAPPKLHPFLEGKVRQEIITIGGKTVQELLAELAQNNIRVDVGAKSMMEGPYFTTSPDPQQIDLVRLHVADLGLGKRYSGPNEIYRRAQDLGLELCPAEVGPQYCLQKKNQPFKGELLIGMKPILASRHHPHVLFQTHIFLLEHHPDALFLYDEYWRPSARLPSSYEFVFSSTSLLKKRIL